MIASRFALKATLASLVAVALLAGCGKNKGKVYFGNLSDGDAVESPFKVEMRAENLVVFRADGSDLRRLTSGEVRDRGPSWSPDGQWIAFGSNRGGDYQIWTVRPDGRRTNRPRAPAACSIRRYTSSIAGVCRDAVVVLPRFAIRSR